MLFPAVGRLNSCIGQERKDMSSGGGRDVVSVFYSRPGICRERERVMSGGRRDTIYVPFPGLGLVERGGE